MTQIAQGAHVYLFPEPGQVYRVQSDDVATVQVLYGAPSAVITLTAQSQTFGPYDSPAKLKVTANTAPAEYTLIRAHYAELTPEQIAGGAVGVLGSNNSGGVVEPDGDVPTLGGSVTLPAMQTAFEAGTAPERAAFQSLVSGGRIYRGDVATQAAMLALPAQKGDWCIRTDTSTVFECIGNPTAIAGWQQLAYPASAVQSVAGMVGVVTAAQLLAALSVQTAAQADAKYAPLGVNLFSGGNLIPNGLGESVANGAAPFNFSNYTADLTYVPQGAFASYKLTNNSISANVNIGDAIIPVPANKLLEVSLNLTIGNIIGGNVSATGYQYLYVSCHDTDGNSVSDVFASRSAGSAQTTLAVALLPGATTITLTDATGWAGANWYQRQMLWWPWLTSDGLYGYKESTGKINMPYTYTRNVLTGSNGAWLASGVSGNVITLDPAAYPSGWPYAALQAGTPVQCSGGGGSNLYIFAQSNMVAGTTEIISTLSAKAGMGQALTLYPGTAKIRIKGLFNHASSAASEIRVSNVVLRLK